MSDSGSFVSEVSGELRRDRMFKLMRRLAVPAGVTVALAVVAVAFYSWRYEAAQREAQRLGAAILEARGLAEPDARAGALAGLVDPQSPSSAVTAMLAAAEEASLRPADAVARLTELALNPDIPPVYRGIARLKAAMVPDSGLDAAARRDMLAPVAGAEGLLGLLAQEQLAMLDAEQGDRQAALERLRAIAAAPGATPQLLQRAGNMIVILGTDRP